MIHRLSGIFYRLIATVVIFLFIYACSKSNQPVADKLLSLKTIEGSSLTVSSALGMPEESYVCILGPYTRRIDPDDAHSKEVNIFLSTDEFLGEEGHWTFLYGQSAKWTAEKIQRRVVELDSFKSINAKKFNSVCSYADRMQISKSSQDKVFFSSMEKK
jgi:hypothetical protein